MKSFLLTGASGVVGSSVLQELLKTDIDKIYILLRAKNQEELKTRKSNILNFLQVPIENNKVIAISGDITQYRLGLDNVVYKQLSTCLTNVIHCAASVQLDITREESFKHSVGSVKHVLEFMSNIPHCKLDYVSTVGVKGKDANPLIEDRVSPRTEFYNTYEEGKYLAELEIYAAIDQGQLITIHRPGMVVGHSISGRIIHFQVFYHLIKLICGRYSSGIVPSIGHVKIDTIPSDLVGQAITLSALMPNTAGKIIHSCSGFDNAPSIHELQELTFSSFKKYGIPLKTLKQIPLGLFDMACGMVTPFLRGPDKTKFELLPQFMDYAKSKQIFCNEKSKELLLEWGIKWPTEEYLAHCLDFYAQGYALRYKESSRDNN